MSTVAYQVITAKYATLHELHTIYSLEDVLNLLEIHQVESYNKQLMSEINDDNAN